jgi:hypothetical protein
LELNPSDVVKNGPWMKKLWLLKVFDLPLKWWLFKVQTWNEEDKKLWLFQLGMKKLWLFKVGIVLK